MTQSRIYCRTRHGVLSTECQSWAWSSKDGLRNWQAMAENEQVGHSATWWSVGERRSSLSGRRQRTEKAGIGWVPAAGSAKCDVLHVDGLVADRKRLLAGQALPGQKARQRSIPRPHHLHCCFSRRPRSPKSNRTATPREHSQSAVAVRQSFLSPRLPLVRYCGPPIREATRRLIGFAPWVIAPFVGLPSQSCARSTPDQSFEICLPTGFDCPRRCVCPVAAVRPGINERRVLWTPNHAHPFGSHFVVSRFEKAFALLLRFGNRPSHCSIMHCSLFALVASLFAAAVVSAQGVTSAIAPSSSPPSGCSETYDGTFEITVSALTSSGKLRKVSGSLQRCN